MRKKIAGSIDLDGVQPEPHEYATYLTLAKNGYRIKLLPTSTKYKTCSPDSLIDDELWEVKGSKGVGKYVIRDNLRQAAKQAPRVVVDLRRLKMHQERAISQLKKYFLLEKRLRRMLIIDKKEKILDIRK